LFLDRQCTQPFPLEVPSAEDANIHRIVVAHGATKASQAFFGGSGSLMIDPDIFGDEHVKDFKDGGGPFRIGQIDPAKGFVHVFDDTSLAAVMHALDTISDFVSYLTKKEDFIKSGRLSWAAGEEELLTFYLKRVNEDDQHDFVIPP